MQRHELHMVPGELLDEATIDRIVAAFASGQSVLVVGNTVARAQQVYQRLCQEVPPASIVLIHGRFTASDRLAKEQQIIAATGLHSGERRPVIVVSTQVVEVSLNIDLDTIYTDPAPLEALLQRFGRVNRNRRLASAPVYVLTEPQDGQGIYLPALVESTMSILSRVDGQPIREEQVAPWLDELYSGPVLAAWEAEYESVAGNGEAW